MSGDDACWRETDWRWEIAAYLATQRVRMDDRDGCTHLVHPSGPATTTA